MYLMGIYSMVHVWRSEDDLEELCLLPCGSSGLVEAL